jgi:hypothetical protein
LIGPSATKQGPDARKQLREGEGLDEVVVSAAVQPMDAIIHGVLCRENQDRRLEGATPQRGQDFDAVASGQHEIEEHDIEGFVANEKDPLIAGGRGTDLVLLSREPLAEGLCDFRLILDDQDAGRR